MRATRSVKGTAEIGALVAVISSPADLHRATRLRRLPDFFELRLDALQPLSLEFERAIEKLKRPLIITARHPLEGGRHNLSAARRRRLLLRFLSRAAYLDLELRSCVELRPVLRAAKKMHAKCIVSVHELRRTPSSEELQQLARRAQRLSADVFKIVTRTDTPADFTRFLEFFQDHAKHMEISAMGVGKFGRASRITLMHRGSALNYAHLGTRGLEGQLSLREALRAAKRLIPSKLSDVSLAVSPLPR